MGGVKENPFYPVIVQKKFSEGGQPPQPPRKPILKSEGTVITEPV